MTPDKSPVSLAAAHVAAHPSACALDFYEGDLKVVGEQLTTQQLAALRPRCSWECDEGCPYSEV